MVKRKIVEINKEKCNGCGVCIPACHEGAIQIIEGKARVIDDKFCDGLGNCLAECPQDAITIIEREAAEYDEEAVRARMAELSAKEEEVHFTGCPGSRMMVLEQEVQGAANKPVGGETIDKTSQSKGIGSGDIQLKIKSQLQQWPVQLMLAPDQAPYFNQAALLITADCVPFAYPDYHLDLLKDKSVVVGCPKLDNLQYYIERLTAIISKNDIRSVSVAFMEVPCCAGMIKAAELAIQKSGKEIPLEKIKISIKGEKEIVTKNSGF